MTNFLANFLPALAAETDLWIESRGIRIPVTLTVPGDGEDVDAPLVVLAHGHGGTRQENGAFTELAATLAEAGIASIRMDFPGCGDSMEAFTRNNITSMLQDVDVGLIPVLWQDNLPQVAIEMHARHIPLLTSDLGGAQELGQCPDMVFKSGDYGSFADRLRFILDGKLDVDSYWQNAQAPVSMDAHLDELFVKYGRDTAEAGSAAAQ